MKKGLTLTEIMVVVVLLAILAAISLPGFKHFVRRSELREVRAMYELVRAAAMFYDPKFSINYLTTTTGFDPNDVVWKALQIAIPENRVCQYAIEEVDSPLDPKPKRLVVYTNPKGTGFKWLYKYNLPDGPGSVNPDENENPDSRYLKGVEGLPQGG